MSSQLQLREIFTQDAARRVFPAAWSAASTAREAGKDTLADELMVIAREARFVIRRHKGAASAEAPEMESVKTADVPPQFAAVAREIARTNAWTGESTLIGCIARGDGSGRRLYARARGKGVAYLAEADVKAKADAKATEAKAAHAKAVAKEKQRLADQAKERAARKAQTPPEIQATKAADLPDAARELAKVGKEKGLITAAWTPLGAVEWDGQNVQVFARLVGKVTRYGIAAA